jgi:2-aminoadipate transaminase
MIKPQAAPRLARRMSRMHASAVRELLKVAERPDVLSFAGGLPAPELFPVEAIAQAHATVLAKEAGAALQYSSTEGFAPLREWLQARLARRGIHAGLDQIIITSGSQQGIDLAGRVLLDPGDRVAIETPSYLAALQAFGGSEAAFVSLDSDNDGMDVDALEGAQQQGPLRLIYAVPEFHNPKGTTLSGARRERLMAFAHRHGVPVLEDDPYGELRFRGTPSAPLASMDAAGLVIHLGTFSKTLAPGMRLGWIVASKEIIRAITIAKQAADLHSSTLSQRVTMELLRIFDYDAHLKDIRRVYGERCVAMLSALERHMPAGTRWTNPDGGLFIWAQLPGGLRGEDLLEDALKEKVAFVPGSAFYADHPRHDFIRLNYSNRPPQLIEEGIARIARAVHRRLG